MTIGKPSTVSEPLKQQVAWGTLVDRLTAWVWDAMRFADLVEAGDDQLNVEPETLIKQGYALYGVDIDADPNWSLGDLQRRKVLLPPMPWEAIATFACEPHGKANRVLVAAGDVVGEAWFRDADGPNDAWGSGWWWAGTGPEDYYSSPVIETNDPPRLWMRLPAAPPIAVMAVSNEISA